MLVCSQTAVEGGHGFEIAVRMHNLRGGDWGETQNKAHRFRSMHSSSSSFSVVFMCLISATEKFKLEKNTLIQRNEVSQNLMRVWRYESLFWTIL